jgi:pseudouridine synthase
MDTTGAILLTNDGNLAQFLMHPKNKIEKEYIAISDKFIDDKTINKVRKGIFIGSGQKGKAKITSQEKHKGKVEIRLILKQGKKNEIRRIFKFLDLNLFSLKRLRIGEIKLGNLPIGSWRLLSKKELRYLSTLQSK